MSAPERTRERLDVALELARVGYYLAPVTLKRGPDGKKRPRYYGSWDRMSTRDPAQIKDWFVQYDCSFLVDTGKSGVVGLDLDLADNRDGIAAWEALNGPCGGIVVDTPSGGQHHYFAADPGRPLINSADPATGIDTRAEGGHVYAPGAVILGADDEPEPGGYRARGPLYAPGDLPPVPELLHARRKERSPRSELAREDRRFTNAEAKTYIQTKLDELAGAVEGGRNVALNTAAFRIGHFVSDEFGTTYEAAVAALVAHLPPGYGDAPGEAREVDATIRSGLTDGIEDGTYVRRRVEPESPLDAEPGDDLSRLVERILLKRQAERIADASERPPATPAATVSLAQLFIEPDDPVAYRIAGLWPTAGKVLVTAPKKAGKTTLIGNLLRVLVDGGGFLARPEHLVQPGDWQVAAAGHRVEPVATGRVVTLLDFEMTRGQLKRWLRDQRIGRSDAVHVELMRGRTWDIRDDRVRGEWATHLRSVGTDVLLVDPIGPIIHALGIEENSNSAVGQFLTALDRLCAEAGIAELFTTHHTGHDGERGRGASAFLGWPDAIWSLVKDEESRTRFLSAEGRDVYLRETRLDYDRSTRRLSLGDGNRIEARDLGNAVHVAKIVTDQPGMTQNGVKTLACEAHGWNTKTAQPAIKAAVTAGLVHVHFGPNRAQLHHPGARCERCPEMNGDPGDPR